MRVMKLENRRVVISENGVSRVLTAPCGVSFNEDKLRWNTWIVDTETGGWSSRSFSCRVHGGIGAFEMALEARKESLSFLLNRRLLPRIRRAYEIREINGMFLVRDPLEKTYRKFTTLKFAAEFNKLITDKWIETYTFNIENAIQLYFGEGKKPRKDKSFEHFVEQLNRIGV